MKLLQIVKKFETEGYVIKYRVRKDGGILITSINNKKYRGASGNKELRILSKTPLSEVKQKQLESIKPKKGQSPAKRRKSKLPADVMKEYRRVYRIWKRYVEPSKGKITMKKVRWAMENLGKEETLSRLSQAERYARGLAYDKVIDALLSRIDDYLKKSALLGEDIIKALEDIRTLILDNRLIIREGIIADIYNLLYDLADHGGNAQETVASIEKLINGK